MKIAINIQVLRILEHIPISIGIIEEPNVDFWYSR